MNPASARRVVLGAMLVAGVSATINDASKKKGLPTVRIPIAAVVVTVVLSATSDVAPDIAATLAISLAVVALLDGGTATAAFLDRLTNIRPATPTPATPPTKGP